MQKHSWRQQHVVHHTSLHAAAQCWCDARRRWQSFEPRGEPWHPAGVLRRFLVLRDHRIGELPSLLQEYEAFGGLAINWQVRHTAAHAWRVCWLPCAGLWGDHGRSTAQSLTLPWARMVVSCIYACASRPVPRSSCRIRCRSQRMHADVLILEVEGQAAGEHAERLHGQHAQIHGPVNVWHTA